VLFLAPEYLQFRSKRILVRYWSSYLFLLLWPNFPSTIVPCTHSIRYRGVGFLRYYEVKQIPNFLLAAPVLCIAFYICFRFLASNKTSLLNLRFIFSLPVSLPKQTKRISARSSSKSSLNLWSTSPAMLVFVLHLLFLAITALTMMHVQVATRFLFSQSPLLYWFIADMFSSSKNSLVIKFLFMYHAVFIVFGTALFVNFLPWT
jgi:phosphatidylinositol glycan class V